MKNYNIFEVAELNHGNKATIITNDKYSIKVEEVNNKEYHLELKKLQKMI